MNGKMAAIFGVLIIGLAVMAASYAQWTEKLDISGSVATGELDAGFSACSCTDNEVGTGYDAGVVSCELKDEDGDGDNELAEISITNAYPGYEANCTLTIMNTGSIPLRVASVNIDNPNPSELDVSISNDPTNTTLDVGETVTFNVVALVTENAEELSGYSFNVTVDIVQFNYIPS